MIVNARKPIAAEPPARPSRPSVTLTAFVVLQITVPAQTTQTTVCTSQSGNVARVNEIVSLIPVDDDSHRAIRTASANVIQPFFFQKMPRLWAFMTLM